MLVESFLFEDSPEVDIETAGGPDGYTASVALNPGSYLMTGATTFRNTGATVNVNCNGYLDGSPFTQLQIITLPDNGLGETYAPLSFSEPFTVDEAGLFELAFGCDDSGGDVEYWFGNLHVFKIG